MSQTNKTELPTPKKIEDSQKEGNFLFSDSVVTFVTTFMGLSACYWALADLPQRFDRSLQAAIVLGQNPDFKASAHNFVIVLASEVLPPTLMVMGTVVVFGILANIVQVGFVFQGAKIKKGITFEQGINPVSNVKNLFSKHTLVKFLLSTIELILIMWACYYFIVSDVTLSDRLLSCRQDTVCGLAAAAEVVGKIALLSLLWTMPAVAIHYLITAKFYTMDNMMGRDEKEREHKEAEGDPEVKGHRRQLAQEIVNGPDRVPNASAVIRNPTHVAVVVRYEPSVSPMPYVMMIEEGNKAQAIFRRALQENVPLYTDITLARGILAKGEANKHIPLEFSKNVVPFVYWLQNNHPERVFHESEFADILTRIGDVKR